MADTSTQQAPPPADQVAPIAPPLRSAKPVSEALLNDKVQKSTLQILRDRLPRRRCSNEHIMLYLLYRPPEIWDAS